MSTKIILYGTTWCGDCHRSRRFLDKHGISYTFINVDFDKEGLAFVKQANEGRRVVPTILFPDGDVLVEPSDPVLGRKVGVTP